MDNLWLDTNVLLDHIATRSPFDREANILFELAEKGNIYLFTSVLSFCNIAYIVRKIIPGSNAVEILQDLQLVITLTSIDEHVIAAALTSPFTDFEDAVQHFSALHHGNMNYLITRNVRDFEHSQIPVLTPADYLALNTP